MAVSVTETVHGHWPRMIAVISDNLSLINRQWVNLFGQEHGWLMAGGRTDGWARTQMDGRTDRRSCCCLKSSSKNSTDHKLHNRIPQC